MSLAAGIVGLPNVGKSTIFNAITAAGAESANYPFCTIDPNVGVVDVPDARLQVLHHFVKTQRVIPAAVKVVDIAGLVKGASQGEGLGNKFLGNVKETDAILHVVRCFDDPDIIHVHGKVDPRADIEVIELELALADIETLNRAHERVSKKARSGDKDSIAERDTYAKAIELLEAGTMLRLVEWTEREREALRPLFLITIKPVLYVANVAADDIGKETELVAAVRAHAEATGAGVVALSGDIEGEIAGLEPEERAEFMADLGIEESGLERLAHGTYDLLGLQTYFTAGEKEIRAWTVKRGTKAPAAAGVIHTDFERLFIRAEVYSVDDMQKYESEAAIKAAGKLRVEGRDYTMREGDVCHFLIGK
ncbi:Ribosome-binding ATPase YchF [Planctomycetes bacterium Pla163]|uniref:Ribosome-binding ATPase YchF n=1 Tax=Rohdeia mirabilis TaxID=2528008 RepID=A0A518D2K1_9BACT|nr:Ribosome-binding ATPase YchF [Planctomycetes bacterium Pla163]